MKTQIFYFSGTGNSLYIAKKLSEKIPDSEMIPIINSLNNNKFHIKADKIGFVFPIHAFAMPIAMQQFLKNVNINNKPYIFAVATRGGSPCNVFKNINKMLEKKGQNLKAQFFINMPNNYIPIFDMASKAQLAEINKETEKRIEYIKNVVLDSKDSKERDPHGSLMEENILFPILSGIFRRTGYFNMQNKFYTDKNCTGCGTCSKICLSGKIEMDGNKPKWNRDIQCNYCFACIHYCPSKAIQLKNIKTQEKGRYHHEGVSAKDISTQK